MKKLNKPFFLISMISSGAVMTVVSILFLTVPDEAVFIFGGILTVIALIYGAVIGFMMWYKAWNTIQDGSATRTTPGKAVGFALIPLFNIYWAFQMIVGFANDYNAYIEEKGIETNQAPVQLYMASAILTVVGGVLGRVPYLGILLSIVSLIVAMCLANNLIDLVNVLRGGGKPESRVGKDPVEANLRVGGIVINDTNSLIGWIAIGLSVPGLVTFFWSLFAIESMVFHMILNVLNGLVFFSLTLMLAILCKKNSLRYTAIALSGISLLISLFSVSRFAMMFLY